MKRLLPFLLLGLLATSLQAETLTVTASRGERTKTGNLIVVLSPREFRAHSPGLMNVYAGKILVGEGYTTGETVNFEGLVRRCLPRRKSEFHVERPTGLDGALQLQGCPAVDSQPYHHSGREADSSNNQDSRLGPREFFPQLHPLERGLL